MPEVTITPGIDVSELSYGPPWNPVPRTPITVTNATQFLTAGVYFIYSTGEWIGGATYIADTTKGNGKLLFTSAADEVTYVAEG